MKCFRKDWVLNTRLFGLLFAATFVTLYLVGCSTTPYQTTKPGCEPEVWQQLLQQTVAEKGYVEAGLAEIQLCISCPELGKQMGVDCTGIHVDFPPGWETSFEGGGDSGTIDKGGPDDASLKGAYCIVKCKTVYKNCMKNCGGWTWPLTYETAATCHDKCIMEEQKCLDGCLGK